MRIKKIRNGTLFILLALILISTIAVLAASNNVPVTRLMDQSRGVIASELAPSECNSIREHFGNSYCLYRGKLQRLQCQRIDAWHPRE